MSQPNRKYERLEALLSEAKPAAPDPLTQPVDGEAEALKARVASLEAELEENRTKPRTQAISSEPIPMTLGAKPVTPKAPANEKQMGILRARNAFLSATLLAVAHFAAIIYYLYLIETTGIAQFYTLAAVSLALGVLFGVGAVLSRRGHPTVGTILVLGALAVSYPPIATLAIGLGSVLGLALMAAGPMIAFQVLPRKSGWVMTVATLVSGLATLLLDIFGSAVRPSLPGIVIQLLAVSVLGMLGFFIVRQFRDFPLRTKIILGMLVIEGVSLGVLAYFAFTKANQVVTSVAARFEDSVQVQTEAQLMNIVQTEATSADQLFSATKDSLVKLTDYRAQLESQGTILGQGAYWDAHTKLSLLPDGQYGNSATDVASVFLPNTMIVDDEVLAELNTSAFLDFSASGVLKTQPQIVAVYFISALGSTTYYPNIGLASLVPADFDTISQPFYTIADPQNNPERIPRWTAPYQDPAGTGLIVTSSAPVYNADGIFKGVIGIDMQLARISENITKIKIGETGFAFLVDETGHILAMPPEGYALFGLQPEEVPVDESPKVTILGKGSEDLQAVTTRLISGKSGLSTVTINGIETYVAFAPLDTPGYSLGVIVPVSELNSAIVASRENIQNESSSSLRTATLILIGLLVGAIFLSLGMGQVIATPLTRLTQTAEKISSGDLSARAVIDSRDETGVLAGAFNHMTDQLNEILSGLEQRVLDRTHDLELASEVGRTITEKVANLDEMLTEAAEMIRSRFDLYYTQVYLTDPSGHTLVLRAGTGDVGEELLKRGHRLTINSGSLNGQAVLQKKPVIVADTLESANFKPNPLLPNTRSEVAVPLIVGGQVIGVLDMQSERPGSLNESNLPAFEALGGQLAVALQNASLFAQAEEARAEVEAQMRDMTEHGWKEFMNAIDRGQRVGYAYDQAQVVPLKDAALAPIPVDQALSIPIQVTGARVGMIQVANESGRNLSGNEQELLEATANQLAQHIENLRLLAQAEGYRAEAEQAVRRLTREGWNALQMRGEVAPGYVYDLNEVKLWSGNGNSNINETSKQALVVRDETIGELAVDGISESTEASELLAAVAGQLSGHIENLRLSEQNEKRALEMETVAELSAATSTVLDPDTLLQSVVDLTKERFGLYHAHIYLADESWSTLLLAAGAGETGRQMVAEGWNIPMSHEQSIVAGAARSRKSVIANNMSRDKHTAFLSNYLLPDTRSELAVPMIAGDKLLGVFDVQASTADYFSEEDANLYTTLAAQVAVALQNARLYAEQTATVTQLRELDRLKSSFLANMSHELRTPLNSILGFSDVMLEELDGPLTDNMQNDLGLIQKNGQHLLHLINDVLDMAKIEAGRMNLNPEKFRVHEILEEVTSITSPLASEKNLSLFISKDSDMDVEIFADRTRLRQVMIDLVNNSIKFTEKGNISIHVSRKNEHVLICVKDTGIGIPVDKLEDVFQEFAQVDTSTTRKAGGTGLGLPISRRLIKMHGGHLWAESSGIENEGSTFFVELPLEAQLTEVVEKVVK